MPELFWLVLCVGGLSGALLAAYGLLRLLHALFGLDWPDGA